MIALTWHCIASMAYAKIETVNLNIVSGYIVKRGNEYRWIDNPMSFRPGLRIEFKTGFDIVKHGCIFTEYSRCNVQQFKIGKVVHEKKGYVLLDAEPFFELNNAKVDRLLSNFK